MSSIWKKVEERAREYVAFLDMDFVTNYIRKNCREEADILMERAEELLGQRFLFADKWDMEPCGDLIFLEKMEWQKSPNGDPEWVYMLNRHDYLHKLMAAWYLTGEKAYADKLKWYLFHWIDHNPILPEGSESTRTIDTGIRCMNWQYLILHLAGNGLLEQSEGEELLRSMSEQLVSLKKRYIGKYTLSNWGVLQVTAICQGYLLFGEYLPQDGLKQWAWEELKRQAELQVMEDGSHWEQSIMYHIEVLLAYMRLLSVQRFLENDGKGWKPAQLPELVDRMSRYVLHCQGPDHRQPAQCDSDATDVRDIMVKAAILTGKGEYKFTGTPCLDVDSLWLFGKNGAQTYENLTEEEPESRSFHARDTGNIYFRSSWKEDGNYTCLSCGPLGSGHGHGDMTHISLYYGGRSFLTDSGRYSYREDEPLRMALKGPKAHNVCVIDGESMAVPKGSWSYESYGDRLKNDYRNRGPVHYAEMAYQCTLKDGFPCLVIRKVMAADCGIWLVVNEIHCSGEHRVKEYYHLDPAVRTDLVAGTDPAAKADRRLLSRDGLTLVAWGSEDFVEEDCVISPKYNQLSPSICLAKEKTFKDRAVSWSCFYGSGIRAEMAEVYQFGKEEPAKADLVTAMTFALSEKESWTFLLWNRETFRGGKMYQFKELPVYGKSIAVHCLEEERTWYRLRN